MNTVDSILYQNFLAAGNAPIEVDLTAHPTTLVVGKNGAGKSTLHEAICFAWFGRPLRKINKPSLVNWINNRDCLVELKWHVPNGTKYMVRRGIKPNIFEIYKNGTLEPVPANVDDYQAHLESIIKLNHKSFMQVVVLGGSSYVPFMRLAAAARRAIIEDLLDIEVFSSMNALAKEDLIELKTSLDKNTTTRTLLGEQVKMAQSFEDEIEEQIKQRIETLDLNLTKTKETIEDLLHNRVELETALVPYKDVYAAKNDARAKVTEFEKTLYQLQTRSNTIGKERDFYTEHDSCPTCEQSITDDFKQGRFSTLNESDAKTAKALLHCHALIKKYRTAEEEHGNTLAAAERLHDAINSIDAKLPLHHRRVRELEQDKARAMAPKTTAPKVDTDALIAQLEGLQQDHNTLSKTRVVLDAATMLLKDNGIKTRVIRHYLPIINKHINHYLTEMDFPILFTFDEEFEEHIKTHHGDNFEYEQFSDGEKKRIDLALLLTWRSVARLKNSASTNLLVMDEVLDSSLDLMGMEEAIKLIHTLESDCNVFVMSHRGDANVDKFAHVITYEKIRGFSQIKA